MGRGRGWPNKYPGDKCKRAPGASKRQEDSHTARGRRLEEKNGVERKRKCEIDAFGVFRERRELFYGERRVF